MFKHFVSMNVSLLSVHNNFSRFIGTKFLLERSSSSVTNVLINRERGKFLNKELVNKCITYEDYTKSWRILASHGLTQIGTLNINLNRNMWINQLWHGFQGEISSFNYNSFLKHRNTNWDEFNVCTDDDKDHLSIMK